MAKEVAYTIKSNLALLDVLLKAQFIAYGYVAAADGSDLRLVLYDNKNLADAQAVDDALLAGGLALSQDTLTIAADGVDEVTVVCNDAKIAGDSVLGYAIESNGVIVESGDVQVSAGSASVVMSAQDAGSYNIMLYRKSGDMSAAYVNVEAL